MRLKTNAQIASEKIDEMMREHVALPISWQYLSGGLELPIILETTFDEIILYLNNDNYMRPGYDFSAEKLRISTLFAKVNYRPSCYDELTEDSDVCLNLKNDTIKSLLNDYTSTNSKDGFKHKISPLKGVYQEHLLHCLEHLLDHKEDYFSSNFKVSNEMILHTLGKINNDVFTLYNNCDLQYRGPRIILDLSTHLLTIEESITLLFLNKIGFDVIIINHEGKADIENYVVSTCLNVYYTSNDMGKNSTKIHGKSFWRNLGIGIIACVVLLGFSINWMINSINDKHADSELPKERSVSLTSDFLLDTSTEKNEAEEKDTPVEVEHVSNTTEVSESKEDDDAVVYENRSDAVVSVFDDVTVMNSDPRAYSGPVSQISEDYINTLFKRVPEYLVNDGFHKTIVVNTNNAKPLTAHQVRTYDFDYYQVNDQLIPNVYLFQASTREPDYLVSYDYKFAVDGAEPVIYVNTGDVFLVDILRQSSMSNSLKYVIHDENNNNIGFAKKRGSDYQQTDLTFIVTNKKTKEKFRVVLGAYGREVNLKDGSYSFELEDCFPQNQFKVSLRTNDIVIKDGVFYYEDDSASKLTSTSEDLVFKCNIGDVFIIDLSQVFFSSNDNQLFYDVSIEDGYYRTPGGFREYLYFNKIESENDVYFSLYATDMYGTSIEKKVHIQVVEEDLEEVYYK